MEKADQNGDATNGKHAAVPEALPWHGAFQISRVILRERVPKNRARSVN